jgi:hypothetical protein
MMRDWISVDQRLPKSGNDVIVFTKTGEIEIGNYICSNWLTSSYGEVLYWMPLPIKPNRKSRTVQNTCGIPIKAH